MTESDQQLLIEFEYGRLDYYSVLERFSVDLKTDINYIKNEIQAAIKNEDQDSLQLSIQLLWFSQEISGFTDELNELLLNRKHISHQRIAKALQDIKSPSTIPFVRKVLETNFDYLDYTGSDTDAIAKWFSWILYSIGTEDAIALMEEYTHAPDEGIADEMKYRLAKVHKR